jgi:hypothetical protein
MEPESGPPAEKELIVAVEEVLMLAPKPFELAGAVNDPPGNPKNCEPLLNAGNPPGDAFAKAPY